jgi:antitoxin Phd
MFGAALNARPEGSYILVVLVVSLVLNPRMGTWQVCEAKTRLSEVIERARTEGLQMITRHGAERAVVISIEDYRALVAHKPDFKAHLVGGPKVDDFTIERDRDTGRPVEL